MQLDRTREVTGIDEEQRVTDETLQFRIEDNSFLHRYPEKRDGLNHYHPKSCEKSSQTAVLKIRRSIGSLSDRLGLLLLAYNYIHKHNTTNKFAVNWVQDSERGWLR